MIRLPSTLQIYRGVHECVIGIMRATRVETLRSNICVGAGTIYSAVPKKAKALWEEL
jgi:hypothetical protein